MNLNTLHHYLTTLSPSELRYRAGEHYTGWENMPKVVVHGKEYSLLNITDTDSLGEPHPASFYTPGIHAALPEISIKKNSRFNPVPEHIHPYIEINYVYSGQCPQVIDGKPVTLMKNQVLLIDTNCPHSIEALGENDIMISIIVKTDFLRDHMFSQFSKDSILSRFFINAINEKTNHNHYLLFHSENDRRIPLFFNELFCECFDPSINSNDIILHLFYTIMAELINVYENDLTKESAFSTSSMVIPMLRFIERNFQTCTQESVADFFHISPNYVTRLLKKYTGLTYIQLIQEQKLEYASKLLRQTTLSVTEIAHKSGYENVTFFYKKFQQKYHCHPSDFRKR